MRLGRADRIVVSGGVVATTADAMNCRPWDFARLGVFVVPEFVAPAALNKVRLIAAVNVLDTGTIHADPLPGGLRSQGVAIIDEREDDSARVTPDALGVDLEVRRNRHEGAGKQGVGTQFRGQVLTDHALLVHRGNPTELCPGESPNGAKLDEFAKQGPDNVSVGEYERGAEFASKR
jgi:hypothetical protein